MIIIPSRVVSCPTVPHINSIVSACQNIGRYLALIHAKMDMDPKMIASIINTPMARAFPISSSEQTVP